MADTFDTLLKLADICEEKNPICGNCPISGICTFSDEHHKSITKYLCENGLDLKTKIDRWAEEHPPKTYLTDFLEKFPNCKLNGGIPVDICCETLGYCKSCGADGGGMSCEECWNTEMDD